MKKKLNKSRIKLGLARRERLFLCRFLLDPKVSTRDVRMGELSYIPYYLIRCINENYELFYYPLSVRTLKCHRKGNRLGVILNIRIRA